MANPLQQEMRAVALENAKEGAPGEQLTLGLLQRIGELAQLGMDWTESFCLARYLLSRLAMDEGIEDPQLEASELTEHQAMRALNEATSIGEDGFRITTEMITFVDCAYHGYCFETGHGLQATLLWQLNVLDIAELNAEEVFERKPG